MSEITSKYARLYNFVQIMAIGIRKFKIYYNNKNASTPQASKREKRQANEKKGKSDEDNMYIGR